VSDQAQAMQALLIANTNRLGAAEVRREVAAGVLTIDQALEDPRAQCMPIGRLLCARRGWGPTKANQLLNLHRIWPTRRVRDLTARQRRIIAEAAR
jgi:hypothetical protein